MVNGMGLEPMATGLKVRCSTPVKPNNPNDLREEAPGVSPLASPFFQETSPQGDDMEGLIERLRSDPAAMAEFLAELLRKGGS